jgi:hypothetical protein
MLSRSTIVDSSSIIVDSSSIIVDSSSIIVDSRSVIIDSRSIIVDFSSINDISRVIRMMPQLGAALMIVILTTLEMSFMLLASTIMLLENIYSTGVTHDDRE